MMLIDRRIDLFCAYFSESPKKTFGVKSVSSNHYFFSLILQTAFTVRNDMASEAKQLSATLQTKGVFQPQLCSELYHVKLISELLYEQRSIAASLPHKLSRPL